MLKNIAQDSVKLRNLVKPLFKTILTPPFVFMINLSLTSYQNFKCLFSFFISLLVILIVSDSIYKHS